jgi:hypothetical protein
LKLKENDSVAKGALNITKDEDITIVYQFGLNSKNEIVCDAKDKPIGRRFIAKEIDQELKDLLMGKDLIIFE